MTIALVEDDSLLSDTLCDILQSEGYKVESYATFDEAQSGLYEKSYDAVILDVNLPDGNGFDLALWLREQGKTAPILFLTAQNDSLSVKKGFESGGDDYLKKPFEPLELTARVANLLRRTFIATCQEYLGVGSYRYDVIHETLYDTQGSSIHLHTKEKALLKRLLQHRGHVVPYNELFEAAWDFGEDPSMDTLRAHMKSLRKLLPSLSIESVRLEGYKLDI